MCDEGVGRHHLRSNRCPDFRKVWLIPDVFPCQTVDVRELELLCWGPDEVLLDTHEFTARDKGDTDSAGAISFIVRSLEIDGSETRVCRGRSLTLR